MKSIYMEEQEMKNYYRKLLVKSVCLLLLTITFIISGSLVSVAVQDEQPSTISYVSGTDRILGQFNKASIFIVMGAAVLSASLFFYQIKQKILRNQIIRIETANKKLRPFRLSNEHVVDKNLARARQIIATRDGKIARAEYHFTKMEGRIDSLYSQLVVACERGMNFPMRTIAMFSARYFVSAGLRPALISGVQIFDKNDSVERLQGLNVWRDSLKTANKRLYDREVSELKTSAIGLLQLDRQSIPPAVLIEDSTCLTRKEHLNNKRREYEADAAYFASVNGLLHSLSLPILILSIALHTLFFHFVLEDAVSDVMWVALAISLGLGLFFSASEVIAASLLIHLLKKATHQDFVARFIAGITGCVLMIIGFVYLLLSRSEITSILGGV